MLPLNQLIVHKLNHLLLISLSEILLHTEMTCLPSQLQFKLFSLGL